MKNHAELLLVTSSMCQSRDILIHVLFVFFIDAQNIFSFGL